jgi:DNA-binding response OmpR family regulator
MLPSRVLLAHRDSSVQELATRALARIGVDIDVVADPADAVLQIAREPYTVIAIEPDDAVIAAIAQKYVDKRPVVIVTAAGTESGKLDADVISMVVTEPYDSRTLVGVILACVTPIPPADLILPAETGRELE